MDNDKISLYNTTDNYLFFRFTKSTSETSYYTTSPSMLTGKFNITQKVFELRHFIQFIILYLRK